MKKTTIFIIVLVIAIFIGIVSYLVFPETEEEAEIETKTEVSLFFSNSQKNPDAIDCSKVYPVIRKLEDDTFLSYSTLEKLLKGPNNEEKKEGYFTNINQGVEINSLDIENGIASVDFSSRIEENIGGSCLVLAIRSQIEKTLEQFESVNKVIISVEGKTEEALQP